MKEFTTIATVGLDPFANHGIVNPPVYHASTILFPTLADWKSSRAPAFQVVRYGRIGTPTTLAPQAALNPLDAASPTTAVGRPAGAGVSRSGPSAWRFSPDESDVARDPLGDSPGHEDPNVCRDPATNPR